LTAFAGCDYLTKLITKRRIYMTWAGSNEADIQAAQSQAGQQARVPGTDEDCGGSQDAQPSSEARARPDRGQGRREVVREAPGRNEAFPRGARIRLGSEIRGLLERGKRKRTKHLDVFFAASPVSRSRLGLIVPKHGHNIVKRNLVKRRLREIGRRTLLPRLAALDASADVLVRARRRAYDAEFAELERELLEAVEVLCSQGF
jgi:ribonuclease P protein component